LPPALTVTTRNAAYQQWQALLMSRSKRQRTGEFLVQGVRPITLALRHGAEFRALLYRDRRQLSSWARDVLDQAAAATTRVALAPELLAELGEKDESPPELVAVVALPADSMDRVPIRPDLLTVVFDRPATPGNIGTLVRSADAFGATAVIVSGHGADPYDPRAVRASTGSLFALPVVRTASHQPVLDWVARAHDRGVAVQVVGTDEGAALMVSDHDFAAPTVLVVGNETRGLSVAWRAACDVVVAIPMAGSASSLNAAVAATVVLYEAAAQRTRPASVPGRRGP
jgi:23S rRNA (uridine2479-2'-O)-methyltransferase